MRRKALIIEDDQYKIRDLEKKIFQTKWVLKIVTSVRDGVVEVMTNKYDLIVLDMSLPTFEKTRKTSGGSPQSHGGLEVIREMRLGANKTPTIILSQYPDLELQGEGILIEDSPSALQERYGINVIGGVVYDSELDIWEMKFLDILDQL